MKYSTFQKPIFREPTEVMAIQRLGAMHQTRISFARVFVRLMTQKKWQISQQKWDISQEGFGTSVYQLKTPKHTYNLVIFSNYIADDKRSDRVITQAWDVTCALVIGDVDAKMMAQLKQNVPIQEKGRNNNKVLVLSRANKSVRVFEHIIKSLSKGEQPDMNILNQVGYILRTTAVYGNGKFGLEDFVSLSDNEDFKLSFCAQMCTVYMLRAFSFDWVDFLAKQKGGKKATTLCKAYKRYLGIGNATGLGMSLFLINHPKVVDNWMLVRESALESVMQAGITQKDKNYLITLLKRAVLHLKQVYTVDDNQKALNLVANDEVFDILTLVEQTSLDKLNWRNLIEHNRIYGFEAQEIVISCILELYPQRVDPYQAQINVDENTKEISGVNIGHLKALISNRYQWALCVDFAKKNSQYWFWHISENKEEPRLGIRTKDNGSELELPLDIARQVSILYQALQVVNEEMSLVAFLLEHPNLVSIVRRVWTLGNCAMGEIQVNSLAKDFLPINILRCKLALFGATKFDPRSDRWVRVTFFQNAPLVGESDSDDWLFPIAPTFV